MIGEHNVVAGAVVAIGGMSGATTQRQKLPLKQDGHHRSNRPPRKDGEQDADHPRDEDGRRGERRDKRRESRGHGTGAGGKQRRRSRTERNDRHGDRVEHGRVERDNTKRDRHHPEGKSEGRRHSHGGHRTTTTDPNPHRAKRKHHRTPEEQAVRKYWVEFGGEGNAFLRETLGGANVENATGWEFSDVGKSFAKLKLHSIQDLYDGVCRLYEDGKETDADVATTLGIPTRVYLIAQLMTGLDKLVSSGSLTKFRHEARDGDTRRVSMQALSAMVGASGVKEDAHASEIDSSSAAIRETDSGPSRPRGPKTWDQIQADAVGAKGRKKGSTSCNIL